MCSEWDGNMQESFGSAKHSNMCLTSNACLCPLDLGLFSFKAKHSFNLHQVVAGAFSLAYGHTLAGTPRAGFELSEGHVSLQQGILWFVVNHVWAKEHGAVIFKESICCRPANVQMPLCQPYHGKLHVLVCCIRQQGDSQMGRLRFWGILAFDGLF